MDRMPGLWLPILLLVSGWPGLGHSEANRAFSPEVQVRFQEVFDELHAIERKLTPIRDRVIRDETLVEIRAGIERDVLEAVGKRFPEAAENVKRISELQRQLRSEPSTEESGEPNRSLEDLRSEMNHLRGEIQPKIDAVRTLPEFRMRILSYENLVETAMRNAASEADGLINRRNDLHRQFFRLQREAIEAIRED